MMLYSKLLCLYNVIKNYFFAKNVSKHPVPVLARGPQHVAHGRRDAEAEREACGKNLSELRADIILEYSATAIAVAVILPPLGEGLIIVLICGDLRPPG